MKGKTKVKSDKVVIERVPSYRYRGVVSAAKKLGVSVTAVHLYLGGRVKTLSAAKRERIIVRTVSERK